MKDTVFLVADAFGVLKMTKRAPILNRGEVGVKLTIAVPDSSFKNPLIGVTVDVPEDRVIEARADVHVDEVPQVEETQP